LISTMTSGSPDALLEPTFIDMLYSFALLHII
jgi:hypothetical protein